MDAFHLLSVSVTPVVLISACGLVTLALYNRLNAILARIRAFHQQKMEVLEKFDKYEGDDQAILLEMIDSQITKVTVKAKAIQKGSVLLAFCGLGLLGLLPSRCCGGGERVGWPGRIRDARSRRLPLPCRNRLGDSGTHVIAHAPGRRKRLPCDFDRPAPCEIAKQSEAEGPGTSAPAHDEMTWHADCLFIRIGRSNL